MKLCLLDIEVELLEDLHTGTGTGAGIADAVLKRGGDGLPVIPRTHLKGLLRELAGNTPLCTALFGAQGGPRQQAIFTSLRLPGRSPAPSTLMWTSAARADFSNRAPRDDTLWTVEFLAAGTKLYGQALVPEGLCDEAKELFRRCNCLGFGRRRGDGLVRFDVTDVPAAAAFKLAGTVRAGAAAPSIPSSAAPARRVLRLVLKALEPVCCAATGVPGNLIPTERFIRGQTLQGALIYWLRTWGGGPEAAGSLRWDLISVGDALPLLPALYGEAPGKIEVLPIPLALGLPRPAAKAAGGADASGRLPWWVEDRVSAPSADTLQVLAHRLKSPGGGEFIARVSGGDWHRYEPLVDVHLRNAQGKKRGDAPDLFSIEEIVEDTRFLADLSFANDETASAFVAALGPALEGRAWITIGRGGAPFTVCATWIDKDWTGSAGSLIPLGDEACFRLTLLSDLLLRDKWLRWVHSLDGERLRELSGACGAVHAEARQAAADVRGFNILSGLPRAPAQAIRRGSSFRISGEGAKQVLDWLRSLGGTFGERIELGFGRFRIDADDQPPGLHAAKEISASRVAAPAAYGEHEKLLEAVQAAVAGVPKEDKKVPSRSQWYALRDALFTASSPEESKKAVKAFWGCRSANNWNKEALEPLRLAIAGCLKAKGGAYAFVDAVVQVLFPKVGA